MNKNNNMWKTVAIIFIILFAAESLYLIWAYQLGTTSLNNEKECSYDICVEYDAYTYDQYEKVCSCYDDEEIVYQKVM
jgi:hypothetical protein